MKIFLFLVGALLAFVNESQQQNCGAKLVSIPDDNYQLVLVDRNEEETQDREKYLMLFNATRETVFYLYTKTNPEKPQILRINNVTSVQSSNFDKGRPTRFITHGWKNDLNSSVNTKIRTAYLSSGDYNVIVVDWSVGASSTYIGAVRRVPAVGSVLGQFCEFLVREVDVKFENITLVGHSLGAHVSGIAGRKTTGRIQKIVGLDPVGPLFDYFDPNKLNVKDAHHVENIITNGGKLGFKEPIGTTTFYPNFGFKQPGCRADMFGSCSHRRAYEYFAESLNSNSSFLAIQCQSFSDIENNQCISSGPSLKMGGDDSKIGKKGVYYLATNPSAPFSKVSSCNLIRKL